MFTTAKKEINSDWILAKSCRKRACLKKLNLFDIIVLSFKSVNVHNYIDSHQNSLFNYFLSNLQRHMPFPVDNQKFKFLDLRCYISIEEKQSLNNYYPTIQAKSSREHRTPGCAKVKQFFFEKLHECFLIKSLFPIVPITNTVRFSRNLENLHFRTNPLHLLFVHFSLFTLFKKRIEPTTNPHCPLHTHDTNDEQKFFTMFPLTKRTLPESLYRSSRSWDRRGPIAMIALTVFTS